MDIDALKARLEERMQELLQAERLYNELSDTCDEAEQRLLRLDGQALELRFLIEDLEMIEEYRDANESALDSD